MAQEAVAADSLAAVLLVDLTTSTVVHANPTASAMTGDGRLPISVDEWSTAAGLSNRAGQDLSGTAHPLSRVARGEPLDGELVYRDARRADDPGSSPVDLVGSTEADRDADLQPLWVTGFPLSASTVDADLRDLALVVFMPPGLGTGEFLVEQMSPEDRHLDETRRLHNRAVVATDLSFTISDPDAEDDPLVWVNPAFTRTTGYAYEDAVGRNCRFLQGPDTDQDAVARMRKALAEQRPVVETLLNYRADGTPFWNEVSISPVFDAEGRLVNYVGVQADVTTRVESELRLARAYAAEQAARGRLGLLADVADAVTDLDTQLMLRRVARILTRHLVPWCAVLTVDDDVRLAATSGTESLHPRPFVPERGGRTAGDLVARQVRGEVAGIQTLRAGGEAPDGSLTRWVVEEVCAAVDCDCLTVPVPGRHGVLGLLVLPDGDVLGADDRDLVVEVARRVGLSLDNARLYAREHLMAETLQQSMLPEQTSVPGLDLWSYYAPNVDHAQVGGDWYDVMQPEGAVGVVIGDVVGHDIEAAAAMGQLRSVVRAYAYEQEEPGTVLMRVDQLVRGMRISRTASMVYARLEEDGDGGWEMSWCRAGHLPPMLVQDGRVLPLMEGGGTLVGIGDRPRETSAVSLSPGDVVVFYTDGLIERRSRRLMDGLKRLEAVCADLVLTDAAGIGEQLLASLGQAPEDDMAVVVLRVPTGGPPHVAGGPRQRRWQLTGDPASIARARRLTVQTCELWGLEVGGEAELVVSELVANAVLHGWGTVGLRLDHSADSLLLEVEDSNPHAPEPAEEGREGPGGYGLHVVQRLADWGWRRSGPGKIVWARIPVVAVRG
ncbi:SpoIIE family protein phosphatase [Thalassiella azotivora]